MNDILWNIKSFKDLTPSELYNIIKARVDVFVVEQNCPYPECDNYDQKALHLWAEKDGIVIAYCRIFSAGIKYPETSIGRVLTTDLARGKSIGKTLMQLALETIKTRFSTNEVRISAQDYLIKFYSGFGFKETQKKYLEDDIPHTEMYRT